jgi:hypothetical protein
VAQNIQNSNARLVGAFGFCNKKHHRGAVVSFLQERIYVAEGRFVGRFRVVEIQCFLGGSVTNDEISVRFKPPVLAAALPLLVSIIYPLTASFPYLLVTYSVANADFSRW